MCKYKYCVIKIRNVTIIFPLSTDLNALGASEASAKDGESNIASDQEESTINKKRMRDEKKYNEWKMK